MTKNVSKSSKTYQNHQKYMMLVKNESKSSKMCAFRRTFVENVSKSSKIFFFLKKKSKSSKTCLFHRKCGKILKKTCRGRGHGTRSRPRTQLMSRSQTRTMALKSRSRTRAVALSAESPSVQHTEYRRRITITQCTSYKQPYKLAEETAP